MEGRSYFSLKTKGNSNNTNYILFVNSRVPLTNGWGVRQKVQQATKKNKRLSLSLSLSITIDDGWMNVCK